MESSDIKLPRWITSAPMLLGTVYISYKTKGIVTAIKTFYSLTKIEICKYMYNHYKWFHNYINNKAKKKGPLAEVLVETVLSYDYDFEKILEKLKKIPVKPEIQTMKSE